MSSFALGIPAGAGRTNVVINQIDPQKEEDSKDGATTSFDSYTDDLKGNRDLPDELQAALKSLLKHYGTDVDKFPRRTEVIDARRQRFYDRGYQYIYFNSGQYVFVPVVGGVTMEVGGSAVQMPRYCNVYNIFKPYRRNYCATLSQNPPGVNFEPARPTESLDIKSAECAAIYSEHYDQINPPKAIQSKIGRLFWTDGRVVGWTRHEKNQQKFGKDDDGNPKGEEITDLFGVIEAKVFPITADSQDELTGVIISDDPEINRAKSDYDWIKEDIKAGDSGAGESAFERNARIGILQGLRLWTQAGDSQAHLTERQRMFLRPAAFEHCEDAEGDKLKELFPDGVFAVFVSGEYAEAWNQSIDDCLKVDHALDGDGMNRPSWGKDHMPVQDAFNNYRNMRQEYHDYGIPCTYYDTQLADGNAFREQVSQPGEMKGVTNPQPGQPIAPFFYTPEAIQPPADLIAAEQDLRDALSQLITAVQPALFGGQISKDDRVGVYQMAREQAMGVMALPWGVMQGMFARFKYQAILAAAANRPEDQTLNVKPQKRSGVRSKPLSITIGDLKKGNFRAVPNTDSTFPATRAMKKAAFQEFMQGAEFNPLLAEASVQPDNMEMGAELEGLPDLDIPAARASNRQLDEIDQLLEAGPIPPTPQQVQAAELMQATAVAVQAAATGQKAPPLNPQQQGPTPQQLQDPQFISSGEWLDNPLMQSLAKPSVDVDPLDYHQYHMQAIKNWWNSPERDKQIDAGNRLGLANIKLHYAEHEKLAAAQAPPPPPVQVPPAKSKGNVQAPTMQPPGQGTQPPAM